MIAPERMETFLQQLPVDALWGVGPVTAARLRERGITRLVDVRTTDADVLREAVGSGAEWLRQLADGDDDRPVVPDREPKSSGRENTFSQDLTDILEIRLAIDEMARDAAQWLARKELLCRTVTIKVRYSDFTTVTRSHSAAADPRRRGSRAARRGAARQDRSRAPAGAAARRQRAQPDRSGHADGRADAAVRGGRQPAYRPPSLILERVSRDTTLLSGGFRPHTPCAAHYRLRIRECLEAALEEVPRARVCGPLDGRPIGLRRVGSSAGAPQKIGADRVEQVVAIDLRTAQRLDDGQRRSQAPRPRPRPPRG